MSTNSLPGAGSKPLFSPQQIREARHVAAKSMRSIVEILEDQSGLNGKEFVTALGNLFHYQIFSMEDLVKLVPAFHILTFPEAIERN